MLFNGKNKEKTGDRGVTMLPYKRAVRIASLIKRVVSEFMQSEMDAEDVGLITITGAKISDNLKNATINYSVYGSEEEKNRAIQYMNGKVGAIRCQIGKEVKMRLTPEIIVRYDESIAQGSRIDELIQQIHKSEKGCNE